MGVVDHIAEAKERLEKELHFRIESGDDAFALAVDRAGKKRTNHVIDLVVLWQRPWHKGAAKYERVMKLLAMVTPDKTPATKYRDPAVGAAVAKSAAINEELADILRREP